MITREQLVVGGKYINPREADYVFEVVYVGIDRLIALSKKNQSANETENSFFIDSVLENWSPIPKPKLSGYLSLDSELSMSYLRKVSTPSRRDYFAAAAITAMCHAEIAPSTGTIDRRVKDAVSYADALIAELDKDKK